jgi:hypothetical protein
MLLYGLEEWKERILFPALAPEASPRQIAEFQRTSRVSLFFGGTPRTGEAAVDRPAVVMPEAPAAGPAPVVSGKRKRKEGC